MAINALLSPAPASPASEAGAGNDAPTSGDAFSTVLAETLGKAPDAPPGPVPPGAKIDPLAGTVPVAPAVPAIAQDVPGLTSKGAAVVAVSAEAVPVPAPIAADGGSGDAAPTPGDVPIALPGETKGSLVPDPATSRRPSGPARPETPFQKVRKIDAPPDSPPVAVAMEEGDPTSAPNAPVERPDPISEKTKSKDVTDPKATNPVVDPERTALALAALAPAPATTPDDAPAVPIAPSTTAQGIVLARSAPAEIPATALPETKAAASGPALPVASDLAAVPKVVAAPSDPSPVQAEPGRVVPNAQVAQAVESRSAVRTEAPRAETPKAGPAGKAEVAPGFDVPTTSGGDAPSGDAPGKDAPGKGAPQDPTPTAPTAGTIRNAATERPEAGTDRPVVDRHLVVRQVADRIESLVAARPKDGVVVHLEPRDLGTVTLVVKGLQNALDVQLTASDDRVRQSLESSRPELAQALAPRGIELRELRVAAGSTSTASGSMGSTGGDAGGPNPEGRARPQSPTPNPTFNRSSTGEPSAPRATRRAGREVDLLV